MQIVHSSDRGYADHGWLRSFHTFSFAGYHNPARMGFRALRVINEDRVLPGRGFGTHAHRDMEIISYVLSGAIEHRDSMGNGSVIRPGDVQRMSAGTGVTHSEFNGSKSDEVHFLQIWIIPDRAGYVPGYEQVQVPSAEKRGRLRLVASRAGGGACVRINQDAGVYAGLFDGTEVGSHALAPGRHAWVHVARGCVAVNGAELGAGAAAAFDGGTISFTEGRGSEVLVFDLP